MSIFFCDIKARVLDELVLKMGPQRGTKRRLGGDFENFHGHHLLFGLILGCSGLQGHLQGQDSEGGPRVAGAPRYSNDAKKWAASPLFYFFGRDSL